MKTLAATVLFIVTACWAHTIAAQGATGRDVERIVCTYARAIAADPRMLSAYNNIVKELIENPKDAFNAYAPGDTQRCLVEAGMLRADQVRQGADRLRSEVIGEMLDALELQFGGSTMLDFNRIALGWTYGNTGSHREEYEPLMRIIRTDPSIPGAHALLGVYWHINKDYPRAIQSFAEAARLQPSDHRFHFNLGQAYVLNRDPAAGQRALLAALERAPHVAEPRLSLAALSLQGYQSRDARNLLDSFPDDAPGLLRLRSVKGYLRARVALLEGDPRRALDYVVDANARMAPSAGGFDGHLQHMLPAYLERSLRVSGEWSRLWEPISLQRVAFPDMVDGNDPIARTWYALAQRCGWDSPPADWGGRNACLPAALDARLNVIFDTFLEMVFQRLYFREIAWAWGRACPFLYLWDAGTGQWLYEDTVITEHEGIAKEGEHRLALSFFDGRVQLREVEREISYIDQLFVEATDAEGKVHVFYPEARWPQLQAVDGDKLVLNHGDEASITFAGFDSEQDFESFVIVTTGYYDPL